MTEERAALARGRQLEKNNARRQLPPLALSRQQRSHLSRGSQFSERNNGRTLIRPSATLTRRKRLSRIEMIIFRLMNIPLRCNGACFLALCKSSAIFQLRQPTWPARSDAVRQFPKWQPVAAEARRAESFHFSSGGRPPPDRIDSSSVEICS